MSAERLVRVCDLHRRFGAHEALRGLSFEVHRGEVLGLLGPNGAGKSTTMQILCGALAPSAGSVEICGVDLLERPRAAKRHVGYLPETPPLYVELTVDEYLHYAARVRGVARREVARATARARVRCGLDDVGGRLIGNLSKGYRQRVGIAQAIVHEPALVVLDEPTVGLDPNQVREIRTLIRELGREHGVLLSTHLLPEVQAICDRVQIIDRGQLLLDRQLAELARNDGQAPVLRLGLRRPPPAAEIVTACNASRVEPAPEGRIRVYAGEQELDPEQIVATAAKRDWGLFEIVPEQPTLEELFVALTCGDAVEARAAARAEEPRAA